MAHAPSLREASGSPNTFGRLEAARAFVQSRSPRVPALGLVAGSGLGALVELVADPVRLAYAEIPHMPVPSVAGHAGELVLGRIEGLDVAILSGRVHGYEGQRPGDVVFGVRLLARLATPVVVLTNAAGGIEPWCLPGSLCRIVDHLNLTGTSPLIGPNDPRIGPRFPDMTHAYGAEVGARIDQAAATAGVPLHRGVYAGLAGPAYETPAEVRMLRVLGAAVVGMSTVHEVIALRHMGVRVGALSMVSNLAAGVGSGLLHHDEVQDIAREAGPRLLRVLRQFAHDLAREPLA